MPSPQTAAANTASNARNATIGEKMSATMVSQQAIRFYKRIGYHAYEGITEDFDERERLNRDLGQNRAMIMFGSSVVSLKRRISRSWRASSYSSEWASATCCDRHQRRSDCVEDVHPSRQY